MPSFLSILVYYCERSSFGIVGASTAVQAARVEICFEAKEVGFFKELEKAIVSEEVLFYAHWEYLLPEKRLESIAHIRLVRSSTLIALALTYCTSILS